MTERAENNPAKLTKLASMKIPIILLCLVSFFPQHSDPEIALVLGPDSVQMIQKSQAEQLLKDIDQVPEPLREKIRVALVLALGTAPEIQKCITWEQHKVEVGSWWATPERVYVDCDDPRVGPPQGKLGERMGQAIP